MSAGSKPESVDRKRAGHRSVVKQDRAVGISILLAGSILFWETFSFPTTNWDPLGIAFWPRFLLITMMVIGAYLVFKGSLDDGPFERINWRAFIVLAGGVTYICLLQTIGFLLLTPPFLFLAVICLGGSLKRARVIEAILVAAGGTLFIHLVFVKGLRVWLPEGLLG